MGVPFDEDPLIKLCVFTWVSAVLIWKNIILAVVLTIFRLKDKQVRIPEDATIFGRQRRVPPFVASVNTTVAQIHDWSISYRIRKALRNETEYVSYFLILLFVFTAFADSTTIRVLVYGVVFIVARYVHNVGLIFGNSYARLIGFLFSVLVLGAITLDLAITASIRLADSRKEQSELLSRHFK